MELDEVLRRRRMTRRFGPTPVAAETVERVLGSLAHLPSAGFAQGVDVVVCATAASCRRFWEAASEPAWRARPDAGGLLAAPLVVVPVADPAAYVTRYGEADKAASGLAGEPASAWPVPYWLVDAAFAVHALLLAATAEGLGALFFRLHAPADAVLDALGVPPGRTCVGAVALGHPSPTDRPSGSPTRRERRALHEVVHRDHW